MSKSDNCETGILALVFNATAWADLAENDSTSPATDITVALHTADPLANEATGTMLTSEAAYGSYARQTVARTSGGWTVSGTSPTQVAPVANIDFPEATSGTETITHFSVGTGVSNNILYAGTVTPNISVVTGVTPRLTTASTITED